jgi:hypothetical protein
MWAAQGGRCPIGLEPLGAAFAVDHDHVLAVRHGHAAQRGCRSCVRALVCNKENAALGAFGDDPVRLRRAADYIERFREGRR